MLCQIMALLDPRAISGACHGVPKTQYRESHESDQSHNPIVPRTAWIIIQAVILSARLWGIEACVSAWHHTCSLQAVASCWLSCSTRPCPDSQLLRANQAY